MSNHQLLSSDVKKFKRILWEQSKDKKCKICNKPLPGEFKSTLDHIIPICKGGSPDQISNMQLTHDKCNNLKGKQIEFKIFESKYIKPTFKASAKVKELVTMINIELKRTSNRTISLKV